MSSSPNPLEKKNKLGIRNALTRPMEFGQPSLGFSPPDWTEPLRDIEADSMQTDLNTGRTMLNNHVRLHLGKMSFSSEHFAYSNQAGSYEASGDVLVEQAESKLTADTLTYHAPDVKVVEESFILEPHDAQSLAKRRLSMGRLVGDDVHIMEPTRELRADHVDYDFASEKGVLTNARGNAAAFFYRAGKLQILGPKDTIAEDAWLTTCPNEDPHYRLLMDEVVTENGEILTAKGVHLQLWHYKLPFAVPFAKGGEEDNPWTLDFSTGSYAKTGSFLNLAQIYKVSPEMSLGPRLMLTGKQGVGLGGDMNYDYTKTPSSPLFMTKGELHTLFTTNERGYLEWYHRYEVDPDLVVRAQVEEWSDQYFYKDFFWDLYKNRTTPRNFVNLSYRTDDYIASGTVNVDDFYFRTPPDSDFPKGSTDGEREALVQKRSAGTEKLPEASFHLLERPLVDHLYASFDTTNGYYDRHYGKAIPDIYGARSVNTARLTYDWDPLPYLGVTPFYELQGSLYENDIDAGSTSGAFSNVAGVTLQTRLHREYPGFLNFSAFKHVVVPSLTFSYRPPSTLDPEDTPHYDALDGAEGRTRMESKISNVFYGRDAETKQVWQVCAVNLFQANDFWNEVRKTSDYEVELDLRPRPWWGFQMVGESHNVVGGSLKLSHSQQDSFGNLGDDYFGARSRSYAYVDQTGSADYNRVLTQFYYDDTVRGGIFNTRVGFAYSDTASQVTNEAILYGLGLRLGEAWSVSADHIVDIHDGILLRQTYELRRIFHCVEVGLRFRERQSGYDIGVNFNLAAFSGPPLKF